MNNSAAERIANIGAGERRKRLRFGIVAVVAGIVIAVLLVVVHAPLVWRIPLIFLFYVGALGFFQSRDKT
jgi:Flp pilus assembly protein TadB